MVLNKKKDGVDFLSKNICDKLNMMEPFKIQIGEKVQINENSNEIAVFMETISHIVQEKEVTIIYTVNNKIHISSKTISSFESALKAYGFEKANNKTLVNLQHINNISTGNNRVIALKNNAEIKISRRRMYKFKLHLINVDYKRILIRYQN